jgi:hypothetical protein
MRRMSDGSASAPAIVFGLLTWSVGHALTYLLFAHIHLDPVPSIHWHGGPGPILVAVAGLLTTAAFAGPIVDLARGAGSSTSATSATMRRSDPRSANVVYAPAAFIVVEFVQHAVSGDEGPPAALLVIGLVLHTAAGAVTPLLWTAFVRDAIGAVLTLCTAEPADSEIQPVRTADRAWADSCPTTPLGSRGPPAHALSFAPCPG